MTPRQPDVGPLDVVISIASHDSLGALCDCLASVPPSCEGLRWKAIVLQNVPREGDGVIEDTFPWVTVIRNRTPQGFGTNHNTVLEPLLNDDVARYALVLNDDTSLSPRAITQMVAYADTHPKTGGVAPGTAWPNGEVQPVYYSFPTVFRSFVASLAPRWPHSSPIDQGRGWLRGSCMLLRVGALQEIGVFDTRFFLFFEDTDICARLWENGWCVSVCYGAAITHSAHSTVSRAELVGAMERQLLRSQYLYHQKHSGPFIAYLLAQSSRFGLVLRAAVQSVSRSGGWSERRAVVARLLSLAAYQPRDPLTHEIAANETVGLAAPAPNETTGGR